MTQITTETLLGIVEESTKEMEVCVPSSDYYARDNDWGRTTINYIDANLFKELLQRHINWQEDEGNIV